MRRKWATMMTWKGKPLVVAGEQTVLLWLHCHICCAPAQELGTVDDLER